MKKAAWPKLISMVVPYVAVLIGLYILKNAWIAIGLYHFGIVLFLVADSRKSLLKKINAGWSSATAAAGMVISAMIFPVIFIFWKYMQLDNVHLSTALADFGLYGPSWFFFMIYFSTMQPFLEELYWRGYLDGNHKHSSWADFAFAGYHILVLARFIKLPWLLIAFAVLTVAAYGWRYTAYKLKGQVVPLLSHIVADISIVTAANALIR